MGDDDTPQEQPTPREPDPVTDRYREGAFEYGEKSIRESEDRPSRPHPEPERPSRDDD